MSDQYTPTTEEVRAVWREWNSYGGLINRTGPEPTSRAGMVAEFDRWFAAVKAEAWDEGNLAAYPLQLAVGQFIDNGGDAWGSLDDAYEQVSAAPNPYREQEVT